MTSPTTLTIFFSKDGDDIPDVELDYGVSSPSGFLTWRRSDQLMVSNLQPIMSLEIEDLMGEPTVTAIERLTRSDKVKLTPQHAKNALIKFGDGVRASIAQNGEQSWGYHHSHDYQRNAVLLDKARMLS